MPLHTNMGSHFITQYHFKHLHNRVLLCNTRILSFFTVDGYITYQIKYTSRMSTHIKWYDHNSSFQNEHLCTYSMIYIVVLAHLRVQLVQNNQNPIFTQILAELVYYASSFFVSWRQNEALIHVDTYITSCSVASFLRELIL